MTILRDLHPFERVVNGARYGIEIEIEGRNYPNDRVNHWAVVSDGSLGPDGFEFVTSAAFGLQGCRRRLTELDEALSASGFENHSTSACSVHVHMNVQDLTLTQISSIITTYYILEDWLTEYAAGPDRVGNLFCLRLSDSEEPLETLLEALNCRQRDFCRTLNTDHIRSAALNLNAIARLGTLEFRAHKGIVETPLEVLDWLKVLDRLRSWALEINNPEVIVTLFNRCETPEEFARLVIPFDFMPEIDVDRMIDGARRAQWLAFLGNFDSPPRGQQAYITQRRYNLLLRPR